MVFYIPLSNLDQPSMPNFKEEKRIHRVVFTGGPCAGKTTSINRLRNFFENIGWKVLSVPETATTILSSGIYFSELNEDGNLLATLTKST